MEKGKDYRIRFSLNPSLSIPEGPIGFVEEFSVELVWQSPTGLVTLATLVAHDNKSSVLDDPCASGVNFAYPDCPPGAPGDYGVWRDYDFELSELLCGLAGSSPSAATFIDSFAELDAGQKLDFQLRVNFSTKDNFDNCGEGLFLDQLSFDVLCTGWGGTCQ